MGRFWVKGLHPKIPIFDENEDDIVAFMKRFERFTVSQSWPENEWAVSLSPLLTGQGLQVYSSMPATEADNFKGLQKSAFKAFSAYRRWVPS